MDWFLNDLSLSGQYATADEFRVALEGLIRLRQKREEFRARLYCSQLLHTRPVTPTATLRDAVFGLRDVGFKRLALDWFAKSGPFWELNRTPETEDYFHFEGEDVTNLGLGEAARRQGAGMDVGTFSFLNPPLNRFQVPTLTVLHGLPEIPLGENTVVNVWDVAKLSASEERPRSWLQMVEMARERCPLLMFSTSKAKVGDQFRLHFEWPRPTGQRLIKVVYIGPKITKR